MSCQSRGWVSWLLLQRGWVCRRFRDLLFVFCFLFLCFFFFVSCFLFFVFFWISFRGAWGIQAFAGLHGVCFLSFFHLQEPGP